MSWSVNIHDDFEPEVLEMVSGVRRELIAQAKLIEQIGPTLGRPHVDTLNGSKHKNMKELRFKANDGVWRVLFAFDPEREAVLLFCCFAVLLFCWLLVAGCWLLVAACCLLVAGCWR